MTLCWNPDGTMCTDNEELARRIRLHVEGKYKTLHVIKPIKDGVFRCVHRSFSRPYPRTDYDETKCRELYEAWELRRKIDE